MTTLAIHQCLDRATALLRAKTVCFSWGDFFFSFFFFYLFLFLSFVFFTHLVTVNKFSVIKERLSNLAQ
jgi:hypothetical protein